MSSFKQSAPRARILVSCLLALGLGLLLAACSSSGHQGAAPIDCSADAALCPSGTSCQGGLCLPNQSGDGDADTDGFIPECYTSADCEKGYLCEEGFCVPRSTVDGDPDRFDADSTDTQIDGIDPDYDPENLKPDGDDTDTESNVGRDCQANSDCNDGLFCNGLERCDADGHCVAGKSPCDDAVKCTQDICDEEANSCSHLADHTLCDDRDPCNGVEYCDTVLDCKPGSVPDCNDNLACTDDSCEKGQGCVHTPVDSKCDDSVACTTDTCDAQTGCKHEAKSELCDDHISCTTKKCDVSAGCLYTPVDSQCADAISCTVETCNPASGCESRKDSSLCTDGQLCEPDSVIANPASGCADPPQCEKDEDCNDSLYCNGVETCVNLKCVRGSAPDCNDNLPCTVDSCDEAAKACSHVGVDSVCSNGNPCDGNEKCVPGAGCVPGVPLNCNDGVPCTMDSCDTTKGCVNSPVDNLCNDNISCTVDRCTLQGCQHTPDNTFCNDHVPCTADACDVQKGCVYTPNDNYCDDGIPCTEQYCSPQYNCVYNTNAATCKDTFSCTDDTCELGVGCKNTPNSGNCAQYEICTPNGSGADPLSGCADAPRCATNADCADGNACNGDEICDATFHCQPGAALDCNDKKACTVDTCDPDNGCLHTPNHQMCDDGNDCTADICTSQAPGEDGCYRTVNKDSDRDGYIDAKCQGGNDCDDGNAAIHPGAAEICTDGKDNNCDGKIDMADSQCSCGSGCPSGQACCNGGCADTLLSNTNCGGCGKPCATACWQGSCLPAGKCADALRNLITSNITYSSKNTCGAGNTFSPSGLSATGQEHIYAIQAIPGKYVEVDMSTTDGSSVDNEILYFSTNCPPTTVFADENSTSSSYNGLIIGEDGGSTGDGYKNNGGIFFATTDYLSGDCGRYNLKVNYDYSPSSCQQGALLPGRGTASIFAGLGLLMLLWGLRRARRRD